MVKIQGFNCDKTYRVYVFFHLFTMFSINHYVLVVKDFC